MRETDFNQSTLTALREGSLRIDAFTPKRCAYVRQMAHWIDGKSRWSNPSYELEDYQQIVLATIWERVKNYRYRCPACARSARDAATFERHVRANHPGLEAVPRPTLIRYVHGCVGQALWHTVRPFMRRAKWVGGELPEILPFDDPAPEAAAGVAFLVEAARHQLGPVQAQVLEALANDRPGVGCAATDQLKQFLKARIG